MALLVSDKVDFKTKSITRYVEEYGHNDKRAHSSEYTTIKTLYVPNNRTSNIDRTKRRDNSAITDGDFLIPDRTRQKKINRYRESN